MCWISDKFAFQIAQNPEERTSIKLVLKQSILDIKQIIKG